MSPYFEIERRYGIYKVTRLENGEIVEGKIKGVETTVINLDGKSVSHQTENALQTHKGHTGAVLFDQEGKFWNRRHYGVLYLSEIEAYHLMEIKNHSDIAPLAVQLMYAKIWYKLNAQTGNVK